ncbi:hypothetical protein ABHN11_30435 [Brevibacillus centrosporus]|uniref:hypothetical protein n=1 Tax=Brevibacillus centrosporus TaxID=54910 RepID=UPI003D233440
MKTKAVSLFLLLPLLFAFVCVPMAQAKTEDESIEEVLDMDRQLIHMQTTMQFLEVVANKKGDQKLAKQIAKKSASLSKRNKELHVTPKDKNRKAHQQKIKKQLLAQKGNIKSLKSDYEKQISSYWKQLMPSFIDQGQAAPASLTRSAITTMATTTMAADAVIDPFEPNNNENESYPITVGNLYDSKISTLDDQDFYRFNSGALTGTLTVKLDVPADKDYDMVVMENLDTTVGFGMTSGQGKDESVSFQVKPNTNYYIAIFSFNDFSTTENYHLSLSKITAVLNLTSPIDISLPMGEVPAYKFTAPVAGTYRFYTEPYGGFGAPFDTFLAIFSDEQMANMVGFNDDVALDNLLSEMKVPIAQGQTYFIYVSSAEQAGVHTRLTVSLDPSATVASSLLHESSTNDGSMTEKQIITLSNGVFASDVANSVTVQSLPAGLQPVITRNSNTQLTLQLTGKAVEHESKHRTEGITVTIPKDKVVGALSNVVSSPFGIAFTDTEAIVRDVPQDLNVAAGEKKILKLTAPFSGPYELSTTYYNGAAGEGTSNTVLSLYEDYGQTRLIASNDDGDTPPFSKMKASLKSGQDYYVVLSGAAGGSAHARLSVRYLGMEYIYNAKGQLVQTKQNGVVLTEWIYDGNGNVIQKIVHE